MCDLSLTGWPQIFTAWKEDILPWNSDSKFPWQSFHDKAKVRTEFWQSHKTDRCHWLQSSDHLDYDDDEDNDDGNDDDDNCKCNENDDHNYMNVCHYACIMWLCPIWLNHWTKMLKGFFPHQSLCYPLLHRCQCSLGVQLVGLIFHIFVAGMFPRLVPEVAMWIVKRAIWMSRSWFSKAAPRVSLAVDFLKHGQNPTSDKEILKIKNPRS